MARLYKQSRSAYWFADYSLPDGSRRRISTKKKTRAEADRVLSDLIAKAGGQNEAPSDRPAQHLRTTKAPPSEQRTEKKTPRARREVAEASSEIRPLTLRQLAAAAGVCVATVSTALRNDRRVAAATRQRIQALASELGYKPNPMVSALMASRARLRKTSDQQIIAYTNSFSTRNGWRQFASLVDYFEGARDRAAKCGYQLEEFWLRESRTSGKNISDILFHRGIHGVLLGPLERQMGHASLKWERFSIATLGYSLTRPSVHRAVPDQLAGMRMALRQLRKLGYRRIALVLDPHWDVRANKAWTAGFAEYLLFLRAKERTRPFFYDKRYDSTRFQRWLRKENPDAIISSNPTVIEWMRNEGLHTPGDYGFVSLNRPLIDPGYSGIYQNTRAIGAAAIDLIVGQIHQNERGLPEIAKRTIIDPVWLASGTTRSI